MRVAHRVDADEERLSAEELHALRARLFGETSSQPKPIATVADLAEALGRTPEEIWRQLDRLRAEKEFATSPPLKASQVPLVGVALVLLASAFGIYEITPRKLTEAQIDQRLEDARRELAARPKKVYYPISKVIREGVPPLPGFEMRFEGELTKTTFQGTEPGVPQTADKAIAEIRQALKRAYEQAKREEAEAPKPTAPLKKMSSPTSFDPGPDRFVLNFGAVGQNHILEISVDPKVAASQLDAAAQRLVESIRQGQERAINEPSPNPYAVMPPPGFLVAAKSGTSTNSVASNMLAITPIDREKIRTRLEASIRDLVRRTMRPDELPVGVPQTRFPDKTLDLEITGPLRPIKATLPMAVTGEFKTAADAIRGFERILADVLKQADDQIREINEGKK